VSYKIIESKLNLPMPIGIILIYPCLDFNMACWMSEEHTRYMSKDVLRNRDHMNHETPLSVGAEKKKRWGRSRALSLAERVKVDVEKKRKLSTKLMMTSRVSYVSDNILPPEIVSDVF
jgi:hypothetical protein